MAKKKVNIGAHLNRPSKIALLLLLLSLCQLMRPASSYLVHVDDGTQAGSVLFQTQLTAPSSLMTSRWHYALDRDRSATGIANWLHVDANDGTVRTKKRVQCPSIWPLRIDAWNKWSNASSSAKSVVASISVPLVVVVTGQRCPPLGDTTTLRHNALYSHTEMTAVIGDEQHTSDDRLFNEICLRRSQLIVPRLNDYVPLTIRNQCRADDWSATTTSGGRFSVEKSGLDLVSSTKGCLPGDRIPELQNKIQLAQRCIYANII